MDDEQVALLRKRLELPADNGAKETVFDEALEAAVKGFQATHGAYADGMVGPGTRRLLNQQHHAAASPSRERLILLNMERWRWLPHDLGSYYVNVNIPEFMLRVMKEGKPDFTTRVVVGKPDKQTPVFSNEMQTIVFNPYWNVPNSIKTEEIRPYLVEEGGWFGGGGWNTAVLQRHNLRINVGGREIDPSRIDWNRIDIRSLNIYQPPGPDNVLGNVKFLFPEQARRLHARHAAEVPVRAARARREPWLHAGAEPRPAGADPAQGGPGLDRRPGRLRHPERRRPANPPAAEDPGLHHLLHPEGERRRLDVDLWRPLWPRCPHGGGAKALNPPFLH